MIAAPMMGDHLLKKPVTLNVDAARLALGHPASLPIAMMVTSSGGGIARRHHASLHPNPG
jgi:hypothetical protein